GDQIEARQEVLDVPVLLVEPAEGGRAALVDTGLSRTPGGTAGEQVVGLRPEHEQGNAEHADKQTQDADLGPVLAPDQPRHAALPSIASPTVIDVRADADEAGMAFMLAAAHGEGGL